MLGLSDRIILHAVKFHRTPKWKANRVAPSRATLKNVPVNILTQPNLITESIVLLSEKTHFQVSSCRVALINIIFEYWSWKSTGLWTCHLFGTPLPIGPYFFFKEDMRTVMVTCDRYSGMLVNFLQPKFNEFVYPALWCDSEVIHGCTGRNVFRASDFTRRHTMACTVISLKCSKRKPKIIDEM